MTDHYDKLLDFYSIMEELHDEEYKTRDDLHRIEIGHMIHKMKKNHPYMFQMYRRLIKEVSSDRIIISQYLFTKNPKKFIINEKLI